MRKSVERPHRGEITVFAELAACSKKDAIHEELAYLSLLLFILVNLSMVLELSSDEKRITERKMRTFFGFALSDSMFNGDCTIERNELTIEEVKRLLNEHDVIPCFNPSHVATIAAMTERFEIKLSIPETPPRVMLDRSDAIVVMQVRELPRLTDRHEYTSEEIAQAIFSFAMYSVQ